jgi:hypothetical protein
MQTHRVRTALTAMLLAAVLLVPQASTLHAGTGSLDQPDGRVAPESMDAAGSMGVEWITDWPGTGNDRANWYYSATYLYNELKNNAGWYGAFNWGEKNAWERDFKAFASGGNGLIDSVDLALIGSHGTTAWDTKYNKELTAVSFTSNKDDTALSPGEAYRAYGTNNLEWLAFDSCSVLRDDSMVYWHETFDGLHLMMGFANTMYVVYPGDGGEWGNQMQKKGWWIFGHGAKTVTQAWFTAVEDQQPSGVRGRVLAEELNNYNDYIWGQGTQSPDYPNNGGFWYWDHVSGTPEPLQLTAVPTSLPVYTVAPRVVDAEYVMNIGNAFGLTGRPLAAPDGSALYMAGGISDTLQLRVDAHSGGFLFQDLNELWNHPEMARTLPESRLVPGLAMDFLAQHDNLPGAFGFDPQIPPTVVQEGPVEMTGAQGAGINAAAAQQPLDFAVSYARTLDIGEGQRISVVGPGSRQNLYIGDNGQVIGMKGGWRDVQLAVVTSADGPAAAAAVPIKTSEEAWTDFLANPGIALAQPPFAEFYDTTGKPDPTLAYYEQSLSISQTELIPVWVFVADLYTAAGTSGQQTQGTSAVNGLVASDVKIYVPASAEPLALPQATITSPGPGTAVRPGQSLDLTGTASGGTPSYNFQWSSSVDGILGTGTSLTIPGLSLDIHDGNAQPNRITLLVTDANGQSATDSVDVTVLLQVYLPLILRNLQ